MNLKGAPKARTDPLTCEQINAPRVGAPDCIGKVPHRLPYDAASIRLPYTRASRFPPPLAALCLPLATRLPDSTLTLFPFPPTSAVREVLSRDI